MGFLKWVFIMVQVLKSIASVGVPTDRNRLNIIRVQGIP
jgi:hypothetical protein